MDFAMVFILLYAMIYICAFPGIISMLVTSLAAIVYLKASPRAKAVALAGDPRAHRFLVTIPAHNEQANIAETVRSCLAIDYPRASFEVLVIADNCTDATASRAEEAGARVLERFDASRKSKGHAIEYLIEWLEGSGEIDTLDALVVIDADTTVAANLLEQFSSGLDRGSDWMQCFDCVGNADATWRTRLMAYGMMLYNGISLAGRQALGLSAGLRGNGMCISVAGLRRVPWSARSLVEDQEYSWIVRIAGGRIDFIKDTAVFATMLRAGGAPLANQRRRWEFGRIEVCRKMLIPLLRSPHVGWREKAAGVAEITSPPTALLALAYLILTVLAAFAILDGNSHRAYYALAIVGVAHFVATLALAVHALSPFFASLLPWRFILSLGYFPYYLIWKLAVLARGGPDRWIATKREGEPPTEARSQRGRFTDAAPTTPARGC